MKLETRGNLTISFSEFLMFLFKRKPSCYSKNKNNVKLTSFFLMSLFINTFTFMIINNNRKLNCTD